MGRLRKNKNSLPYLEKSKITYINPSENINLWNKEIFKNNKEIWIEIGMGKGEFTLQISKENKDINFIGIEKYPTVQKIPVKIAEEEKIKNLQFISGDVAYINEWFLENSIDKIFINFPDPWPKSKHEKRRLVFYKFLNNYYKILKKNSWIEFKTDQIDLFEFSLEQVSEFTKFKIKNKILDLHSLKEDDNPSPIKTGYENKFSKLGNKIYYVEFHK